MKFFFPIVVIKNSPFGDVHYRASIPEAMFKAAAGTDSHICSYKSCIAFNAKSLANQAIPQKGIAVIITEWIGCFQYPRIYIS